MVRRNRIETRAIHEKAVVIEDIDDLGRAMCIDQFGFRYTLYRHTTRAKGMYPAVGERWMIDREIAGTWTFSCLLVPNPPTITGTRAANPALANLLSTLADGGLIVDETEAGTDPGEGIITDHGDLSGLNDDDHPQYHNDTRGDLRYSPLGHTHPYEPVGAAAAAVSAHEGAADPHTQYLESGDSAGGDLSGSYPNPTIAANGVSNAKLADMAQATVKARPSGAGTGDPTDMAMADLAAEAVFTGRYGPSDVMSLPFYRAAPHQTSATTGGAVGGQITTLVALPIPEPSTLTSIQVEVTTGTALSTGRVGVYSIDDGRDPANGITLLSDFGTVDMTVTQIVNTTGSVDCSGLRWVMLACWVPSTNPPMRVVNQLSGNGSIAAALGGIVTPSAGRHVQGWRLGAADYSTGLPATASPTVTAGGTSAVVYIKGLFTYP